MVTANPRPLTGPYKLSSLYYKQLSLGATFVQDELGWFRVERFSQPEEEKRRAEAGVGVADISHVVKLSLKGKDVTKAVEEFCSPKEPYRLGLTLLGFGGIRDVLCCLLAHDEALLLAGSGVKDSVTRKMSELSQFSLNITDVSSVYAGLCTLGPMSRNLISKITELNVTPEDFPNLAVAQAPLLHVQAILLRVDFGKVPSYQLYFERAFGEYLWDAIMNAGDEFGISPLGRSALQLLGWRFG